MRIKPRYNPDVNKWWLCDLGRYGMSYVDENRLKSCQKRQSGSLMALSWNDAYSEIAGLLSPIAKRHPSRIAAILSPHLTNEDLFVCKEFFNALGVKDIHYSAVSSNTYHDDFMIKENKYPNSKGAELILGITGVKDTKEILEKAKNGEYSILFIMGQNLVKAYGESYIKECLRKVEFVIMLDTNEQPTTAFAHYILPAAAFAEKCGTFVNYANRIQLIKKAFPPIEDAKPDWLILSELATEMNQPVQYKSEQNIFTSITQTHPPFKGLDYKIIGANGCLLEK